MKKSLKFLSSIALCGMLLASCGSEAKEIAVVTDVGQLKDGGFNEGTYNGAVEYAESTGKTYEYYQPANGSDATDADRITAMETAIKNGASVIVTPGFLQEGAIRAVANENPNVKFVFIDGFPVTKEVGGTEVLQNVVGVSYQEEQSGYFAGYGAVADGYTKLGGVFGGAGANPACNRFAYGYVQGAAAAAAALSKTVEIKISYNYGATFSASSELETQCSQWYNGGTEVIFSCGGSMVNSVVAAAAKITGKMVIGVDVDQAGLSDRVLTSAVKGLAPSVVNVLTKLYEGKWDAELGGKSYVLGAKDDATGLPTADASWRFKTFTKDQYNTLLTGVKAGTVTIDNNVTGCDAQAFWTAASTSNCTVTLEG